MAILEILQDNGLRTQFEMDRSGKIETIVIRKISSHRKVEIKRNSDGSYESIVFDDYGKVVCIHEDECTRKVDVSQLQSFADSHKIVDYYKTK